MNARHAQGCRVAPPRCVAQLTAQHPRAPGAGRRGPGEQGECDEQRGPARESHDPPTSSLSEAGCYGGPLAADLRRVSSSGPSASDTAEPFFCQRSTDVGQVAGPDGPSTRRRRDLNHPPRATEQGRQPEGADNPCLSAVSSVLESLRRARTCALRARALFWRGTGEVLILKLSCPERVLEPRAPASRR